MSSNVHTTSFILLLLRLFSTVHHVFHSFILLSLSRSRPLCSRVCARPTPRAHPNLKKQRALPVRDTASLQGVFLQGQLTCSSPRDAAHTRCAACCWYIDDSAARTAAAVGLRACSALPRERAWVGAGEAVTTEGVGSSQPGEALLLEEALMAALGLRGSTCSWTAGCKCVSV